MPNEHPDHDLLADLAAEVLPDDLAERVQTHVIGCPSCAALLAEAEGIRSLLRQLEPDPMPDAVLDRLERALVVARQEDLSEGGPAESRPAQSRPVGTSQTGPIEARRPPPTGSFPTSSIATGRRISRSRPAAGASTGGAGGPSTGLIGAIGADKGQPSRLSRMSRPAQRARRQALEEQRADRPSRLGPLLKVAAAVLVVAGAGALTLHFATGGSSGDNTASSASDSGKSAEVKGAPVLAPVQSTGTNYARAALKTQVKGLVSASQKLTASGGQAAGSGTAKSQADTATNAPRAAVQSPQSPQGQLLRTAAGLQGCLNAIGADQPPVAVDLARYAGQEAAIIVLPADGGGYEVWVVARDCRPGNDGSLAVVTVPQ
jgi:hypothetical protein